MFSANKTTIKFPVRAISYFRLKHSCLPQTSTCSYAKTIKARQWNKQTFTSYS